MAVSQMITLIVHLILFTFCCQPLFAMGNQNPFQIPGMPPLSEQEMQEMMKFVEAFEAEYKKLSPEERAEIDRQAEDFLRQQGIDPKTLGPTPPQPQSPSAYPGLPARQAPEDKPKPPTPELPPTDCSTITTHSTQQASCLLSTLIPLLEATRQKLSLLGMDGTTLREWTDALLFYLKMMNKPEHLKRLTSETFNQLYELLSQLQAQFVAQEEYIMVAYLDTEDVHDPHLLLGLPLNASQEEIEKRYTELSKQLDLEQMKKELQEAGVREEKITRRLNAAKARKQALVEAYEELSDEKLRAQIKRERLASLEAQANIEQTTREAIDKLSNAVEQLIAQGLFVEIEQFLKRYEPFELAQKKEMDQSEQQRFTEQQNAFNSRQIPQTTPPLGGGWGDWGNPYAYTPPAVNPWAPGGSSFQPTAPTPGAGMGAGGAGAAKPKDAAGGAAKGAAKKEEPKPAGKKEPAKKKKGPKKIGDKPLDKELEKQLAELETPLGLAKVRIADQAHLQTLLAETKKFATAKKGAPSPQLSQEASNVINAVLTPDLIKKYTDLALLAEEIAGQKASMKKKCEKIWREHVKKHKEVYAVFDTIYMLAAALQQQAAAEKRPVAAQDFPGLLQFGAALSMIYDKLTAPGKEKADKEALPRKEGNPRANARPSSKPGSKPSSSAKRDVSEEAETPASTPTGSLTFAQAYTAALQPIEELAKAAEAQKVKIEEHLKAIEIGNMAVVHSLLLSDLIQYRPTADALATLQEKLHELMQQFPKQIDKLKYAKILQEIERTYPTFAKARKFVYEQVAKKLQEQLNAESDGKLQQELQGTGELTEEARAKAIGISPEELAKLGPEVKQELDQLARELAEEPSAAEIKAAEAEA